MLLNVTIVYPLELKANVEIIVSLGAMFYWGFKVEEKIFEFEQFSRSGMGDKIGGAKASWDSLVKGSYKEFI